MLSNLKSTFKSFFLPLLALGLSVCVCSGQVSSTFASHDKAVFRVATYNIRYDAKPDQETGNAWEVRKKPLANLIGKHEMDIVGTQEGNRLQLIELQHLLPNYEYIAHPYGGKDGTLHNTAIYYRNEVFKLLDSGVFWLSETPDIPSIGWDASDWRICQWGKFQHIPSGHVFYFFNAHFYWRAKEAREASGPLLVGKVRDIAGTHPTIVVGDFNSEPETSQIKAIKEVLHDAYDVSKNGRQGLEGTAFSGGVFQGVPKIRIDYIFLSEDYRVKNYRVVSDVYNGDRFPSDHLPVVVDVFF